MRPRIRSATLVLAAIAALTATTSAAAQPSFEVQKHRLSLELTAEGSNGYEATITTVGHRECR